MTLIAAFRSIDLPVLIGDFLLTSSDSTGNRREAGSRKKICRITPNLVVGWSGSLLAAERLINDMRRHFAGARPSKTELEQFLVAYDTTVLSPLAISLIGWVLDDSGEHCFRWRSDWPAEVFYGRYQHDGSGAQRIARLVGEGSAAQSRVPPIHFALSTAGMLMVDEVGARLNRTAGFGYAYEVLYRVDDEFIYLNDVTLAFAEAFFSKEGRHMATRLAPVVYHYKSIEEQFAMVQMETWGSDRGFQIERDLILPPFDVSAVENRVVTDAARPEYPLSRPGTHKVFFVGFVRDADTPHPRPMSPLILTRGPNTESSRLGFDIHFRRDPHHRWDGTYEFGMPPTSLLESMFNIMVNDPDLNGENLASS